MFKNVTKWIYPQSQQRSFGTSGYCNNRTKHPISLTRIWRKLQVVSVRRNDTELSNLSFNRADHKKMPFYPYKLESKNNHLVMIFLRPVRFVNDYLSKLKYLLNLLCLEMKLFSYEWHGEQTELM